MATSSGRYNLCDKSLGMLQELMNKDPESYREEFLEKFYHFSQTIKLLHLQPEQHQMETRPLVELVTFLSSVSHHFPVEATEFANAIISVLRSQAGGLDPEVRMSLCKALVILRNRRMVPVIEVLTLFFELVKCEDKMLRKFVYGSVISHLRKLKKSRGGQNFSKKIQNFLIAKLKDSRSIVARTAQLVLIDAYRKDFLRDGKTANAVAECCFHKLSRIQVASLKFFLGSAKDEEGLEEESDTEEEFEKQEEMKTIKEVMTAFRAAKKTRKKVKNFEKAKKLVSREKKAKKEGRSKFCNLLAIQSLYDAQTFVDRLFGRLDGEKNEKFEVRLLQMALCARVIGVHRLQTLGFYSFLHRYLQPKQREVTRMLLYAAQACHELVPPDTVEMLVRIIAQNFVTDRNTPEAITVGINAIREIFVNCPFAATEELLRDLTEYKKYKNKNVSMAARGLITLFRTVNPKLLHRKDRGRPSEATKELKVAGFGVASAESFVAGAECLPKEREDTALIDNDDEDDDNSSEGSWVDLPDSDHDGEGSGDEIGHEKVESGEKKVDNDDHEEDEEELEVDDDDDVEESEGEEYGSSDDEDDGEHEVDDVEDSEQKLPDDDDELSQEPVKRKKKKVHFKDGAEDGNDAAAEMSAAQKANLICESRILTQEEFRKISSYRLQKQLATRRQIAGGSRKRCNDDVKLDEELDEKIERTEEGDGLPRLKDIENFHKKFRRQTKDERLSAVEEGRQGRGDYAKPKKRGAHIGRTNRELAKRKNFQMVRQKVRGKNRQRSFRDRQLSLKKYLLRQAGKKV